MSVLLLLTLAGCSQQQQSEVANSAERAGESARNAAVQVQTQAAPAIKEAGKVMSDASLTLKVKTALSASDKLDSSALNVDTKDQVVYLKGTVPDAAQKAIAESLAKNTVSAGVKVVNQLQVGGDSKKAEAPASKKS